MNLLRCWALVCAVGLLAGCVTTEPGANRGDPQEAARLNMELGIGYLRQGRLDDAREKLERSVRDRPDSPTAQRALALVYERMGDDSLAERHYRLAVRHGANDADALNSLAVFLCRKQPQNPTEALRLFDRALAVPLYPNRFVINSNAGTCAAATNLPLAERYLRLALEQNPRFPDALFQMASVAYQQTNYLQGRAFLERYLTVASPSPQSLWLGFRLETALNDATAADNYAAQLLRQFPDSGEARQVMELRRAAS